LLDVRPHTGHSCGTSRCAIDRITGHLTSGNRHLDRRHTAWPPVTLRERALSAGGVCTKRTKPPGTSASLAFPCERADHLEVSCSERYRQSRPPSNDCGKAISTRCGQRCGKDVHRSPLVCGPHSSCAGTYAWAVWKPLRPVV
jgi:hypothetical protein